MARRIMTNFGTGHGARSAQTVTVIKVVSTRGDGTHLSPFREIVDYFAVDGTHLWRDDPAPEQVPHGTIERTVDL